MKTDPSLLGRPKKNLWPRDEKNGQIRIEMSTRPARSSSSLAPEEIVAAAVLSGRRNIALPWGSYDGGDQSLDDCG